MQLLSLILFLNLLHGPLGELHQPHMPDLWVKHIIHGRTSAARHKIRSIPRQDKKIIADGYAEA